MRSQPLDLAGITQDALTVLKIAKTNGLAGGMEEDCWLELVSLKSGPVWYVWLYYNAPIKSNDGVHQALSAKVVARIDARSGAVLEDRPGQR